MRKKNYLYFSPFTRFLFCALFLNKIYLFLKIQCQYYIISPFKKQPFFFPLRFYFFQKFNFCFAAPFFLPFPADFCRKGYFRYNAANNKNYVDFLKAKSFFVVYVLPASGRLTLLFPHRDPLPRAIRAPHFSAKKKTPSGVLSSRTVSRRALSVSIYKRGSAAERREALF